MMTNGRDHEEYFGELLADLDAQFEWITPSMPHLGVIGPRSREVVQKLTDEDLGSLRYFRFIPRLVKVAGVDVHLSRTGYGGELGYELFLLDPADAETLWNAVVGAGVTPIGTDAIEVARVEAGLIVTDYDYEPHERTPFDFNLDRMVRLDQGLGFAGEDALRAVAADPPHRFVTLRYEADALPEYGAAVTKDGEEVGVLTSPTDSPRFGKIGLAVIESCAGDRGEHAGRGRRRRDRLRNGRRAADLRHGEEAPPLVATRSVVEVRACQPRNLRAATDGFEARRWRSSHLDHRTRPTRLRRVIDVRRPVAGASRARPGRRDGLAARQQVADQPRAGAGRAR